jgi:hypothetical protein
MEPMATLDWRERKAVAWVHGTQLLTLVACMFLPAVLYGVAENPQAPTPRTLILGFGINTWFLILPLVVPGALYAWCRRRNQRVAFHALQDLYWQYLCNLVAWTLQAIVVIQTLAHGDDSGALSVSSTMMALILAVCVANIGWVAWALFMALASGRDANHPVVARLARAITVGLPQLG